MELEERKKMTASTSQPCNITTPSLTSSSKFTSGKADLNYGVSGGSEMGKLIITPLPTSSKKSLLETIYCDKEVSPYHDFLITLCELH